MGLLDGGLAGVFASALSGLYLDATLYRSMREGDGKGGGTEGFAAGEAVKAQLDRTAQVQSDDNADVEQRILVLASGVATISTDDEITVDGIRWAIVSVTTDPAQAYYDLRGRRSRQAVS